MTKLITKSLLLGLGFVSFVQAAEIKIGALVSAQVTQVHVKVGQTVTQGIKLISLDDRRYQAKLKALQAELAFRELALADAKIEFDQTQDLFDRTVIARRPYERAKLDYDLAQQALRKAEAELAQHQTWLDYFQIKAPLNAKVKSIAVTTGTTVFEENQLLIILETP